MAENKTKPTSASVTAYLKKIKDPQRREDCIALVELMKSASKSEPVMWGTSIVGFGTHHYVYESGREGDTVIIGFSSRQDSIALYLMGGLGPLADELPKLGKYKTGKGCLYVKTLADVDTAILKIILAKAWKAKN